MNSEIIQENGVGTVVNKLKISVATKLTESKYEVIEFNNLPELFTALKETCQSQPKSTPRHLLNAHATGIYTNGKVSGSTCEYINWLLIDIDEGNYNAEDLHIPYQYILHESNSSTPDNRGWHILIPLAKPIYAKHLWSLNYEINCKNLYPVKKVNVDVQCKDTARRFYIPANHQADSFKANFADPLYQFDLTSVEKNLPLITKSKNKSEIKDAETVDFVNGSKWFDVEQVLIQLEARKIDMLPTRADWLKVGQALVDISESYPSRGVDAFVRLSRLHKELNPSESDRNKMSEEEWGNFFIDDLLNTSRGLIHIGTFFHYAKEVGCFKEKPKAEKGNGIIYLIRLNGSQTTFTLPYKNTKEQDIVKLYEQEESMACILKRLKKDTQKKEFQLSYEDVTFIGKDEKTGEEKIKEKSTAEIEVDFRETPQELGYLLGAKESGNYIDKSRHPLVLLQAKHSVLKGEPVFNKNIDDWLKQFPFDYEWLCKYLYWVTDCSVGLPALLMYDASLTGKSFFGLLLGSLFSGREPIEKFFTDDGFCNAGGISPIISMEEAWQGSIEQIKSLITSNRNEINQKQKGLIKIYGYHRLVISHNQNNPNIPKSYNSDTAATDRRFQLARFKEEHTKYMATISREETDSWLLQHKFLNHVEWIKREMGSLKKEGGAFAINTYRSDEQLNGMSMTSNEEVVVSDFVLQLCGEALKKESKKENKEFIVSVNIVREKFKLSHKRISSKGDDDLAEFIRNIFGGKGKGIICDRTTTTGNPSDGKRVRIPMEIMKRELEFSNRQH